jgi:four helix bundle protein
MGSVHQFEDLESWKKARELAKRIYSITSSGPLAHEHVLRSQLRRAVVSISSNIAEGFERSGDGEFVHFLSIAKGSCGEIRSQLYIARDQEYLTDADFEVLVEEAKSISRLIAGLMKYIRQSGVGGFKYKKQTDPTNLLRETLVEETPLDISP